MLIIVGVCLLLLTLLISHFRRLKRHALAAAMVDQTAPVPIAGKTQVTQSELAAWYRAHAESVQSWIEHHERVHAQFADTTMAIDLTASPTQDHEQLGLAIDEAIAQHPEPHMRAQLSALALASRNTVASLRRSDWSAAEKEHAVYLRYRDTWLARVHQFTIAESGGAGSEW